jgi:hypothetical protein
MSTNRMDDNEQPFEHLTIRYRKIIDWHLNSSFI